MKVLITGANGFVGSHIVEKLLENKEEVSAIVRKTSNLKWIKDLPITLKYGSLDDAVFLESCAAEVDAIVHCAGTVRAMDKEGYFKSNVENTANLCRAALNANPKLKRFIYISSQAAMGPSASEIGKKLDEDLKPASDYGESKLAAEKALKNQLKNKIPYTILRPASVYGPRDKDIFIFFNLVNKHLKPITAKKRLIQLVFVKDIAKAVISAINNEKSANKTFYLAQKKPYSWKEVAETINKTAKKSLLPVILPDFIFKIAGFFAQSASILTKKPAVLNNQKIIEMLCSFWIADTEPAENDLGIVFTSLELGSEITYNWYLKNKYF
ncbi:MAG: NAD-dependent epimerase/dehydratase family protein [Elusimicrobiota bacterium]|jgi:nucleoside-diphosphate-sugar epimerase|nr:NAD-dependent epimerase/dehydratase family protein [Elusimicrobiota bacterium]